MALQLEHGCSYRGFSSQALKDSHPYSRGSKCPLLALLGTQHVHYTHTYMQVKQSYMQNKSKNKTRTRTDKQNKTKIQTMNVFLRWSLAMSLSLPEPFYISQAVLDLMILQPLLPKC